MNERTCAKCGAKSDAGAEYCWQCYTRFAAPAALGPPARGSALTAALGRGPGAGTPAAVLTEPATVTRWQPTHGSARDAGLGWLVRGVVFVVAAAGSYFGYQWLFGVFPFPDEIAGQERMESKVAEDVEDLLAGFADSLDVDIEMAVYGNEVPAYFLLTAEVPAGQDIGEFYRGFVQGSGVAPDGLAVPTAVSCAAFPGDVGAQCSWVRDETVILLQGFLSTPEDLQGVAEDVRAELD